LISVSLRLLSHERRHSISVCESPLNSNFVRKKSDEISDLDVNEDTRHHVASIWESHDWGRALECLSLTLEEVQHIRSVLTKAEIETLAVTKSLREDLENGKICFTCLKTRFSFWGPWPQTCKLCERAICERYLTIN
jgi:spire-like protein